MPTPKSQQKLLGIIEPAWLKTCVNHLNDAILITEAEPID
jgi:hypothetical protein